MVGRFSLVKAREGKRDEVVRHYQGLDEAFRAAEGYVASLIFVDPVDHNEVGRVALWRSRDDAERHAADDHIMYLRSQIHLAIQPEHTEKLVEVVSSVNL